MFTYHIFDLSYNKLIENKDPFEINLADKLNKTELDKLYNQIQTISVQEIKNINFMNYSGFKLLLNYDNMDRDFLKLNPNFILDKNYHNEFISEHIKGLIWKYKIVHKLTNKNKLVWIDTKLDNGLMKRNIGKNVKLIIDLKFNKIKMETIIDLLPRDSNYIKPIKNDNKLINKFITLDLECYGLKNDNETKLIPFLVAIFNPLIKLNKCTKLDNIQLYDFINLELLNYKYSGYIIYAHNLSSFDGIFILNKLVKLSEMINIRIEPLFRYRKLIQIKVYYGYIKSKNKYRYSLIFRDSMLILLSSLDKLSKTFLNDQPELQKDSLTGKDLINQIINKSKSEIDILLNDDNFLTNFKKYCIQDCISLWYILDKFNILIFDKYQLNIHNYPTLPSLAFAIYRSSYLKKFRIPKISGDIFSDIKHSYTGGHCDVYNLYSNKECRLYDFVSLYPSVMLENKFPIGLINRFKGNPLQSGLTLNDLDNDKVLSFIKCDIYVDKSINRPVYQTHIKSNNSIRSMCATGLFENQWIYLPELLEYQRLTNNKIRIIDNSIKEGYMFESKNIFKDYISELFKIKQSVTKNNPWYLISKIIMNNLYGRFGLKNELQDFLLFDKNDYNLELILLNNNLKIEDVFEFDDSDKVYIINKIICNDLNSAVPVAAAVTAYARMKMAPLLLDSSIKVLYIDTDSFVIEGDLEILNNGKYKYLLHDNIGGLKLETIFYEFIALAPKLYGGILNDNTEFKAKIKGFKDRVEFDTLKNLLFSNDKTLLLNQEKWFRSKTKGDISIKSTPYTLELNENKRKLDLINLTTIPHHFP